MDYRMLADCIREQKGLGTGAYYDRNTGCYCALGCAVAIQCPTLDPAILSGGLRDDYVEDILRATQEECYEVFTENDSFHGAVQDRRDHMLRWAEARIGT